MAVRKPDYRSRPQGVARKLPAAVGLVVALAISAALWALLVAGGGALLDMLGGAHRN